MARRNQNFKLSVIINGNPIILFIEEEQVATTRQSHKIALSATSTTSAEVENLASKVLNTFILVACFGFVSYTILNVDQGMTRGWSMPEKATRIPLVNWASYESSLNTHGINRLQSIFLSNAALTTVIFDSRCSYFISI